MVRKPKEASEYLPEPCRRIPRARRPAEAVTNTYKVRSLGRIPNSACRGSYEYLQCLQRQIRIPNGACRGSYEYLQCL